jgi:beta-lactamase regulating signal transducer with metallopeptidase domain
MTSELLRELIALTIASTLSILVTLAIRRGVRAVFGAVAAYSAWLLVPAAMLALLLPTPHSSGATTIGMSFRIDPISTLNHALDGALGASLQTVHSFDWAMWAIGAWAAGAALFCLYLAGLQRAFVKSLGTLSGSRCVLRATQSAGCPALLGVLRPKIILPIDFESRYTRLERLLVFSHERTHLRRGDALWNALVALIRCLLWFNPLVHLASKCFREDQELACDAAVMEDHPAARRKYAMAMLKTQLADAALPVGCRWHSMHQLEERLRMLKNATPSRRRRLCGRLLVALASLLVGYAAWATEPYATGSTAIPVEFRGLIMKLRLDPDAKVDFHADHITNRSNGTVTLEGHVHIDTSVLVARRDRRSASIEAEKAVITPRANGGVELEIENGFRFIRD